MKYCLREGDLRARLDGELPAGQAEAVDRHLAECAACAAAYRAVSARAARVSAWMDSLSPDVAAPAVPARRSFGGPAVWTAVAAIAAALILAFALPRHPAVPVVKARVETPPPATPPETPRPVVAASRPAPGPPVHRVSTAPRRTTPVQYYMALDEEPIDTGVVMRVALPTGMQADVIVDGDGRARAIRPVSYAKEPQ